MDDAVLGMDRIALRRRNLIPPDRFPYLIPSGTHYDSGDYVTVLTKALAQDLAEFGIRVNCISPGQIETSRESGNDKPDRSKDIPLGRRGEPFEIAGMVRSLCGPAGAYMTGQTLHINGGLSNSGV